MTGYDALAGQPAYLQRYLRDRAGCLLAMPEFHGGMAAVVEDLLSERAKLGLRELAGLVPRARYRPAPTGELITLLATVPVDGSARQTR